MAATARNSPDEELTVRLCSYSSPAPCGDFGDDRVTLRGADGWARHELAEGSLL